MIHEQHMKLRRLICNAFNPGTACDCWKGEDCPKAYPLAAQKKLEDAIVKLFNEPAPIRRSDFLEPGGVSSILAANARGER
jgi:hypothetical protein